MSEVYDDYDSRDDDPPATTIDDVRYRVASLETAINAHGETLKTSLAEIGGMLGRIAENQNALLKMFQEAQRQNLAKLFQ